MEELPNDSDDVIEENNDDQLSLNEEDEDIKAELEELKEINKTLLDAAETLRLNLEEKNVEIDSLKSVITDLSMRLQNAHHTVQAQRHNVKVSNHQTDVYRRRIGDVTHSLRMEFIKNVSNERKKLKDNESNKYEIDKKASVKSHEELRLMIVDQAISGTRSDLTKIKLAKSKIQKMETIQDSRKQLLHNFVQYDEMSSSLCNAAQHGDVQQCMQLLKRGAPCNEIDAAGYLAIHYACANGHFEVVRLLLEFGSDATSYISSYSPLTISAKNGHINVVKLLVDFGSDINCKDIGSCPPIVAACENGHYDCLQSIIALGADINQSDLQLNTVLHVAVNQTDPVPFIRLLLKNGANINACNVTGQTPLQYAYSLGKSLAIEALGGRSAMVDEVELGTLIQSREGGDDIHHLGTHNSNYKFKSSSTRTNREANSSKITSPLSLRSSANRTNS